MREIADGRYTYDGRDKAQVQRDLNPHKAARFAMWHWSDEYARGGLGSMAFWDRLGDHRQDIARRAVAEICAARDEKDA